MRRRYLNLCFFLIAISVIISACGGGSTSSSSSTAGSGSHEGNESASGSSGGRLTGLNAEGKRLANFGEEAEAAEREAASKALEANLSARASEDWVGQCASLSVALHKEIAERSELIIGKKGNGSCPKGLELEAEPFPKSVLKNPMTGPIDALRVEGRQAYALFRGTGNKDYGMPMVNEDGDWKVTQLTTIELGKG
jgi:hypothetical protein